MHHAPGPEPIRSPSFDSAVSPAVRHGFFTRHGGVSTGLYDGLNVGLGSGDRPESVVENRRLAARALGVEPEMLVTVFQVHSPDAVVARGPFPGERPRADAIVTDRPGVALGVVTADCGPVLFADAEAGVIGAAHAGWKGALDGVLENTIAAMERLGARRRSIVAVLGPSISQDNYEVGPEFVARFLAADPGNSRWFVPSENPGRSMFDLRGYTVERLSRSDVAASMLDQCTYAGETRFFSYRRATHRGETDYGRQISAIVMEGP